MISTKEELYSNETVEPAEMRSFLKTLVNTDNYVTLTRLSNLDANLYVPLVNALYFHFLDIKVLQRLDLFNADEINKILEEVVIKNFLNAEYPERKEAHNYIWYRTEDGIGLGEDLIHLHENERRDYAKENVQAYCNYYSIYTHTISYYAYPSQVIFEQNFSDMVLDELLQKLGVGRIEEWVWKTGLDTELRDLRNSDIKNIYIDLYDRTLGIFKNYYDNDKIVRLTISSNYRLNGLEIYDNISQALWNWNWPRECTTNMVNTLVNEVFHMEPVTLDNKVEAYARASFQEEYLFKFGVSADIARFFLLSEYRYRVLHNEEERTAQNIYLKYLSRFKTLISTLCTITRANMKVSSPLNLPIR